MDHGKEARDTVQIHKDKLTGVDSRMVRGNYCDDAERNHGLDMVGMSPLSTHEGLLVEQVSAQEQHRPLPPVWTVDSEVGGPCVHVECKLQRNGWRIRKVINIDSGV